MNESGFFTIFLIIIAILALVIVVIPIVREIIDDNKNSM